MTKIFSKSSKLGFTLMELMVVVAIIAVLSAVLLAALGTGKSKTNDSKVQSQLKAMANQAQLYGGAQTAVAPTTAAIVGVAGGNMFTDTTSANNSLYLLGVSLPAGTVVYYGKNGTSPLLGGLWAFAASTSTGSNCVDHTGIAREMTGTVMTAANASTQYPNIANSNFTCL